MKSKILVALVLASLFGAYLFFDLGRYFSLAALQAGLGDLRAWQQQGPWLAALIFFLIYVSVTGLSVPGAAVMTLAAGALFGLGFGTLLVSFASTLGATLAMLASRYLLRDAITKKFGARLSAIDAGLARDGAFYLFTLRLVPVFPFFVINLLMGLTRIPARRFFWVSQLGMLPGTVVYVNAGTQLAQLKSLSDVASPTLWLSLALLGILPWIGKALVGWLQTRRRYSAWQRPKRFDRNLIVIGAGAAGLVTSYIGAAVKAKVSLIEAHKMGGDCLNYGCVPSKALIKSAKVAHQIRHAEHYGLSANTPSFSLATVMQRVLEIIRAVEPHDSIERYTGLGVDVIQGYAKLVDPWTVEIALGGGGSQRLSARSIVIAAGAAPFVPALPGLAEVGYLTSDTLWESLAARTEMPKRMVVLGGGPIGCELAHAFARLGVAITQIEQGERLLKREDEDVSQFAHAALSRDGVRVLTSHKALRCEKVGAEKVIIVEHAGVEERIVFDDLICAVGRVARLDGYGLEALGIETNKTVLTNEYLETLYPNIFAAGDVAGPYQFTHAAAHQAWYASVNALFGRFKKFKVDYSVLPWTTFIDPEIARVGLNEQEAKEKGVAVEITRYGLDDLDRAIADGAAHGFVKVLTEPGRDRILGVTIVGEHAGDLLAEFVLAMKHGLGLNKILSTIHTYPTWAEANKYAAGEWKRAHAPQRVLAWLERYHRWQRG